MPTQRQLLPTSRAAGSLQEIRGAVKREIHDPRIQRSLKIVGEDPGTRLSRIAGEVNLSVSRFRHLFKEELGVAPGQYIRLIRLQRAKELFQTSFLRIKEVACLVGVDDISHFVRNYTAFYNETPSQTRASWHEARQIPRRSQRRQ
jgi:transcriptional regulator GlxA family with amidase domain